MSWKLLCYSIMKFLYINMCGDMKFFRTLFKFVSFLGLTPLQLETRPGRLNIVYVAYPAPLAVIYGFLITRGAEFNANKLEGSILNTINVILESSIDVAFTVSCLLASITSRTNWNRFFDLLERFEQSNRYMKPRSRVRTYIVTAIVIHVLMVIVQANWCFTSVGDLRYLFYAIFFYMNVSLVFFHYITLDILTQRNHYLSKILRSAVENFFYHEHKIGDFFHGIRYPMSNR